ncbi:hypothetical protein GCM10027347_12990 [Larkinella harenae]
MADKDWSEPLQSPLPLILIRGFGGLGVEDEKRIAYQGFNDGTVYPQKLGENYIYEGLILRFMKSNWQYQDATNVVGYYGNDLKANSRVTDYPELQGLDEKFFSGSRIVIDPAMAVHLLKTTQDPLRTIWVFRYYDLDDRAFENYGKALVRLIDFIQALATVKVPNGSKPKVNIIAHSMGGLIAREAVQRTYPKLGKQADAYINKIVTLGTPHQGISFQVLKNWIRIDAENELEHFNPDFQANSNNQEAFTNFHRFFPLERLLTVVGTNYRTYSIGPSSWLNRVFSVRDEFGANYNRSDGLVKQTFAQIPGAPRTFVHKCHGGFDSLVTSREAFEIATRFFFGNVRARLRMIDATITRGMDLIGKSEFYFGVSIKPRKVDFDLFHQSAEAENCYGPFSTNDLRDTDSAFDWAGPNRLIWEGYLNTTSILEDQSITVKDMVIRLDFYVGERDLFGIGFSDNVIFRKQYYIRAMLEDALKFYLYTSEEFADKNSSFDKATPMDKTDDGWTFNVSGSGFAGVFQIEIDQMH